MYVYVDGRFIEEGCASIPISDRGFLYGDGLFTTVKVEGGEPLYLDEHLANLHAHMERFGIEVLLSKKPILDLIELNGLKNARLKILVTGGDSPGLGLPKRRGRLVILMAPLPKLPESIRLRPLYWPLFPGKMLSYMPRLFLREQARPCDDCLLLNERGEILETAFGNLYWEIDGVLCTPDPDRLPIYWGVSMQLLSQQRVVQRVCTTLDALPERAQLFRINALSVSSALLERAALE